MEKRGTTGAADADRELVYAPPARGFHWATVLLVTILVPLGLYMVWRGNATNFDAMTNTLYDTHKTIGFGLLCLIVARLIYRLRNGAPPDEPTLEPWQRVLSHLTHWGLYALLLVIPALGWLGVSFYGARSLFGLVSLPPISAKNEDTATLVFTLHYYAAMLLVLMVTAHVGAAIYHHVIRGDGVLRRMLPSLPRR